LPHSAHRRASANADRQPNSITDSAAKIALPRELDARNAQAPEITPLSAPQGAPNVIIVLLDDMGFGASTAYGGPCNMPVAERLAREGLTYTRFHTIALCSPTRHALLTGRNHHSVNMAAITELATGFPGYTSVRPHSAATIARILKLNGYNTAAFGKMHQTPVWETRASGPFDRWPTGDGFAILRFIWRRNQSAATDAFRRDVAGANAGRSRLPFQRRYEDARNRLHTRTEGNDSG